MKKLIVGSILLLQSFFCFSQSLNFDGVDDYLEITPFNDLSETDFTLEVWVKIPSDNNAEKMNLFSLKNCVNGFNIYLTEEGFPEFKWYGGPNDDNGSIKYVASSQVNIKDNEWHHLTFMRNKDLDQLMISIDGSHNGTISSNSSGYDIPLKGVKLIFGENLEDNTFGKPFSGTIDDLSIWKRYLLEEEITDRSSCVDISLVGYQEQFWFGYGTPSGDNTSITHAASSAGPRTNCKLENFNLQGDTSNYIDAGFDCRTVPNNRVIDYGAVNFDGNDDFIILDKSSGRSLVSTATVEVWVKIPKIGTQGLEVNEEVGPILGNSPYVSYGVNENGQPKVNWNNGEIEFTATKDLRDNEWHHIAYVRNEPDNKFSIYIDGIEDVSINDIGTSIDSPRSVLIGGDYEVNAPKGGFHGNIDDIRLWPEYLTTEEINVSINSKFEGAVPFKFYKSFSFNLGVKPVTEILSRKQTEAGNNYYMSGFRLVGDTSNFVEGHTHSNSLTDYDIINQRIIKGQTLFEISDMLRVKSYLFGKEFENEFVFDYDKEEKSFSLVGKTDLGKGIWGWNENLANHNAMNTSTDIGSGYQNTLNIGRISFGLNIGYFSATDALKHNFAKKTFLPSLGDLGQIKTNLSKETLLKYFNKEYVSSSSKDGENVYTYDFVNNVKSFKRKNTPTYVLPIRKVYENPIEKDIVKITDNLGYIIQKLGGDIWVRYHPNTNQYEILRTTESNSYPIKENAIFLRNNEYDSSYLFDGETIEIPEFQSYRSKYVYYEIDLNKESISRQTYYYSQPEYLNIVTSDAFVDDDLQIAITLQSLDLYKTMAKFNVNGVVRHEAIKSTFQSIVHRLEPTIKNYEYYLKLPNKHPDETIYVQHKLDDLYWAIAKRENTVASLEKYLLKDKILNKNHYKEALDAYHNYEYIVKVKMKSIKSLKAFDGASTEATLELVWDIDFFYESISDTYTVYPIEYPNHIPGITEPLFTFEPSFPLPFNQRIDDPFNGYLYETVKIKNNTRSVLSYKLYDEDGRSRSGNDETDRIGTEKGQDIIIHEKDLELNVPKNYKYTKTRTDLGDTVVETVFELTKFDQAGWAEHIRVSIGKCSEITTPTYSSKTLNGPGYLIRNETDFDLDVSLDNFGPLYYGLIKPGETFVRDTGPWLFTISAAISTNGVPKTDIWDAIVPIVDAVITAVSAAFTGGAALGIKGGIYAAYQSASKLGKVLRGAKKAWNIIDKTKKLKGKIEKVNDVNEFISNQMDETFTFAEEVAVASGIWGLKVPVYRVVGGPKKPCIDDEGTVTVRESEPLKITGPHWEF